MPRARGVASACLVAYLSGLPLPALAGSGDPERPFLEQEYAAAADSTRTPPDNWLTPSHPSYTWGLLGSAVGIGVGVGIALWVKSEADKRYDLYLKTAEPEQAQALFDTAERYDRAALIGWGLAEVSFVGLVYFLTRSRERTMVPVRGEPALRLTPDGPQLGFTVRP
jgi:hypothetical protein